MIAMSPSLHHKIITSASYKVFNMSKLQILRHLWQISMRHRWTTDVLEGMGKTSLIPSKCRPVI